MSTSSRWWRFVATWMVVALVLGPLGVWGPVQAAPQVSAASAPVSPLRPQVGTAERADTSAPLRELAAQAEPPARPAGFVQQERLGMPKSDHADSVQLGDPVLQSRLSKRAMPAPQHNFDGIYNTFGVAPPDTDGDIGYDPATGKKYYVQWVNLGLQAWDVTTETAVTVLGPINGNTIWSGFGGRCESDNDGDPVVLFDPLAKRWVITQFAVSASPYYECIAISKTGDPTGEWHRYAFNLGNNMNDYPKFGVWPDGYYMTDNQFLNASSWAGAGVYAFNRDKMLVGDPTANFVYFNLYSVNNNFGGMLPSDFDGTTPPPAGTPNFFFEVDDTSYLSDPQDSMRIWEFHVDWSNPANSTFGLSGLPNQLLPVANYDLICDGVRDCIPQSGATQKLDAIGDRLMFRAAYRNFGGYEAVVLNHTVDADSTSATRAGVRWYEVRRSGGTWSIYQQGTYAPNDGEHRWMASIAQDHVGNTALGFSASGSSIFPAIRYTGRLAGDPLGEMSQGEATLHAGTAAQTGVNRWGDYSMLGADPQDDCTFWYTQEYSGGGWDWRTRIGSFKFPNCSMGPQGTLAGTVTDANSAAPVANASIRASLSPTETTSANANASGNYAMTLAEGSYMVEARAYGYQPAMASAISVVSGTTTTQNFQLTPVATYVISGTITDAQAGWPLYAEISIAGNPYNPPAPYNHVWTDPATGFYSVTLAQGYTYTFNVAAWSAGYLPLSRQVVLESGDQTVNMALSADTAACTAPGYGVDTNYVLTEAFDAVAAPELPTGWMTTTVTSTNTLAKWQTITKTIHPAGVNAYSAPNMIYFNSYSANANGSARLYTSGPVTLTGLSNAILSYWMYHDTGYTTNNDRVQTQVSLDDGATWINVGAPVARYRAAAGWDLHKIDLSAYITATSVRLGLFGISAFGNDVYVDDLKLGSEACVLRSGGLVLGNVYEDNMDEPLVGAQVSAAGKTVSTVATADPAVDEGFYVIFAPTGETPITASMTGGYETAVVTPTIVQGTVLVQDFSLRAGMLTGSPAVFDVSLVSGQSITSQLTMRNDGGVSANLNLAEVNAQSQPLEPTGRFAHRGRHLGPKNLDLTSLEGIVYYLNPPSGVEPLEAGTVGLTWTIGVTFAWGLGYDTDANNLWVGNPSAGSPAGDDKDYQFLPDGTKTGLTINTKPWIGSWAADMTYNPFTKMLWQVNVGGDNCIYELDPVAQAATGRKICPAFGVSQRGLAYDPTTDTFFSGSWSDTVLYRFDGKGTIIEEFETGVAIAGLAFNPATGHLFVTANDDSTAYDVYVLDANDDFAILGGFNLTGMTDYGQSGLEIDCNNQLWAVNQKNKTMMVADSGETGVCTWKDIPWLTRTPDAAVTIAAGGQQVYDLAFNAAGMQPGVYKAQLFGINDTPYGIVRVPLTLTVTVPQTWGQVAGTITGLGYCDGDPAPLADAEVRFQNAAGLDTTVTTAADGSFGYWIDETADPLTVTVSAAGHVSKVLTGVMVTAQTTTTANADLRVLQPCVSVSPDSSEVSLMLGETASRVITLTNAGALGSAVDIKVYPGNATPGRLLEAAGQQAEDARVAPAKMGRMAPIYEPSATILTEGFEAGVMPPTGWSQKILNTAFTWAIDPETAVHSGTYAADVKYDEDLNDQDEWLLSPVLSLSNATLSFWSAGSVYWCKVDNDNCDLNVWLVRGEPGGGDDVFVGKAEDAWSVNWTYAQSTYNLTPLLPGGPVRIGFQYIGNDGAQAMLDDIVVSGEMATGVPWLTVTPLTTTVNADGSTSITLDYTALMTLTPGMTYHAELSISTADPIKPRVSVPVAMQVASAPLCSFTASGPHDVGTTTLFTNTTMGSSPISYTWDFADGTPLGTAVNPTHTYALPGLYTVILTATNTYGTASCTGTASVLGPPVARFTHGSAQPGAPTAFTNLSAVNPAPTYIQWNFGDPASGSNNFSTASNPSHVFATKGVYTVTLSVTNIRGMDTYTSTVSVGEMELNYIIYIPVVVKSTN